MKTYIIMVKLHTGGLGGKNPTYQEAIAEGAPETRRIIKRQGGKLIEAYLTAGPYDGIMITEFPNDVACTRAVVIMRDGFDMCHAVRAFPESDWAHLSGIERESEN